jgi:hypothetical protein
MCASFVFFFGYLQEEHTHSGLVISSQTLIVDCKKEQSSQLRKKYKLFSSWKEMKDEMISKNHL